ncbi:hypothetical protein EDB83DRAFT_2323721 [Lactarius deliciosus]|nr:hypothetical protein EDB83DRAFT_2323721 [Lactarius deliciosus]
MCVPTKIWATGMDSPKAIRDVKDGGNSEDSQRMDGFIRCCLGGIKSVVIVKWNLPEMQTVASHALARRSSLGGHTRMYKKVLFQEQKSEVLQLAAKSPYERIEKVRVGQPGVRQGWARTCCQKQKPVSELGSQGRKMVRQGWACTSKCRKSCKMPCERIEVTEKVRVGQPGQGIGEAGVGTYEQMSEVMHEQIKATKKVTAKSPHERIEAIEKVRGSELGLPGQENGQGRHTRAIGANIGSCVSGLKRSSVDIFHH